VPETVGMTARDFRKSKKPRCPVSYCAFEFLVAGPNKYLSLVPGRASRAWITTSGNGQKTTFPFWLCRETVYLFCYNSSVRVGRNLAAKYLRHAQPPHIAPALRIHFAFPSACITPKRFPSVSSQ